MTRVPTEADLSAIEMEAFWGDIRAFDEANTTSSKTPTSTFATADVLKQFTFETQGLQEGLQGVWWMHQHPTFGEGVFSFRGADKDFKGNAGKDLRSSNFTYVSNLPGATAVPNNPKNVSKLVWLHEHGLEYSLPYFNSSTEVGAGSYLNVAMDGIYGIFPLPAAIVEGWSLVDMVKWEMHKGKSHDVARCFCSFYWTGPDQLTRNNFGRLAYSIFRIADGQGRPTRHHASFLDATAAAGITSLAVVAAPAARPEDDVLV